MNYFMNDAALRPIVELCRQRLSTTVPHELAPLTLELLEMAVVELAERASFDAPAPYAIEDDPPTRPDNPISLRPKP